MCFGRAELGGMVMEPSLQSIGVQWFGGDQEMERVAVNYGDAPPLSLCSRYRPNG